MRERTWHVVDVTTLHSAHEAIEYALAQAGANGTETSEAGSEAVLIRGYFDQPPEVAELRSLLLEGLRIYGFAEETLTGLKIGELADRDWLAEWKKDWRPVETGRFIVAPPWIEPTVSSDRIVIHIDPGMAFGTGTHETTRLCLKAIEKYFRGGSFLDVGTGTGLLAIAAARMFPEARVVACDTDTEAIEIAKENALLNDAGRIEFRVGSVEEQTRSADFVCANLTAPVIVELLPRLLDVTCGRLVLSGILDSQIESVESSLFALGATPIEIQQDGEWAALVI